MLSQYYKAICYPFEEMYKKNMHEQQKKAQMARQHSQQIPPVSSAGPSRPLVPGTQFLLTITDSGPDWSSQVRMHYMLAAAASHIIRLDTHHKRLIKDHLPSRSVLRPDPRMA